MYLFKFILISLLIATPAKEDWVRIKGDKQMSFLFPSRGQHFKKNIGNIPSWIFQTKNVTCVFGVVCTQLLKEKGQLDSYTLQQLYVRMKKESVSMPTARLKSEKTILHKNMDIKEICYTIIKNKHEMTYYKQFIFRDNCMYQVTIGAPTSLIRELEAQKEKFFNSVQFDDKGL